MKYLDSVSSRISAVAAVIAATCTLALALALTTDVVVRFATGRSLVGMVELAETFLVVMVFLALAYCGYSGAHISVDVLTSALPGRAAATLRVVAYALVIAFILWMIVATGSRAFDSFVQAEFKFGLAQWPLWPARWAIVLGLVFTVPVFILTLVREFRIAIGKDAISVPDANQQFRAVV